MGHDKKKDGGMYHEKKEDGYLPDRAGAGGSSGRAFLLYFLCK